MDDYSNVLMNHNFPTISRPATIKTMLQKEFSETIGFHNRLHKNQSVIVYDVSKEGSFIESAVNFWRISIASMIKHVAKHTRENFRSLESMVWPPSTADLEITSEIPDEILKFLIWLRNSLDDSMTVKNPKIISLRGIIFSYITNKRA